MWRSTKALARKLGYTANGSISATRSTPPTADRGGACDLDRIEIGGMRVRNVDTFVLRTRRLPAR
jgi:aspartyl protease family protein